MKEIKYSFVIPVFNEAENIVCLYNRIKKVADSLCDSYQILLVDDGSTDGSYAILKDLALKDTSLTIISFKRNFGQHPAVIAGFREAAGQYIITLDADLQNPPEEVPKLIKLIEDGYDMVAGRRSFRKDVFMRRMCSILINHYFSFLTGVRLYDYGTMLRVFRRSLILEIAKEYELQRLYIPVLVCKITKKIVEIDVSHDYRYKGSSKYNLRKLTVLLIFVALRYYQGLFSFLRKIKLIKEDGIIYEIKRKVALGKEILYGEGL